MPDSRRDRIVDVFTRAFGPLAERDPAAFRVKYRKMAADPFAFYRGSACLFYADVVERDDEWVDERSSRVWIHGDLHPENFGTYLDSNGRLVFDVNDFDEAYLGHFTWDLMRFAAGLSLLGWQKALPDADVRSLIETYLRAYLDQVGRYHDRSAGDFAVDLRTARGPVLELLRHARRSSREALLDAKSYVDGDVRRLQHTSSVRPLDDGERSRVDAAFEQYLQTIPEGKRYDRELFYEVSDVAGVSGFGIGSAGLPAYTVLVEGFSEALDDDVLLSMKQANVPAVSLVAAQDAASQYFAHEGHRTVVSQRALQVHSDQLLGWTEIDGVGFVVSEMSPYELDLDWEPVDEPDDIAQVVETLGRATAKVHCASDADSDQDLVGFQTEQAVLDSLSGREDEFVASLVGFGVDYAADVRSDHARFVDAFREGDIGVTAT